MNPYYDPIDRKRVNAFKDHTNAKYDLHDPNDPANRQPYTPNMRLPKEKKRTTGSDYRLSNSKDRGR